MSVTYVATLPVRDETVAFRAGLLEAERARRGTRTGTRSLSCHDQAVFVLRWFLDGTRLAQLVTDLAEVRTVLDALPELRFPINSAGALTDQLAATGRDVVIADIPVDVVRMLKYMPAYYFPIVSYDNFIEKMAELVRANRPAVDVPDEAKKLRAQMPELRFPIRNRGELARALAGRTYRFQGGRVELGWAIGQVPDTIFPIDSDADLDRKLRGLIARRPLITGHGPTAPKHPVPPDVPGSPAAPTR